MRKKPLVGALEEEEQEKVDRKKRKKQITSLQLADNKTFQKNPDDETQSVTDTVILTSEGVPMQWVDLEASREELRPFFTLTNGQCFHWKALTDDIWVGVVGPFAVAIRQSQESTFFADLLDNSSKPSSSCVSSNSKDNKRQMLIASHLREYFQLHEDYSRLRYLWNGNCSRMERVSTHLKGVRVLKQDPWECLASFIFSSNNNIQRITKGLRALREKCGNYLCNLSLCPDQQCNCKQQRTTWKVRHAKDSKETIDEKLSNSVIRLFTFPTPEEVIQNSTEEMLRGLGFGYRARYLRETAQLVVERGGPAWLDSLRNKPRLQVRQSLMELPGVGPKVADCVALFSLDQHDSVPVDTHVRDICARDYVNASRDCLSRLLSTKTLTPRVYELVGDVFREKFQEKAGWAHSVLFTGELPQFKSFLPPEMQREMVEYSKQKRQRKKTTKGDKEK